MDGSLVLHGICWVTNIERVFIQCTKGIRVAKGKTSNYQKYEHPIPSALHDKPITGTTVSRELVDRMVRLEKILNLGLIKS